MNQYLTIVMVATSCLIADVSGQGIADFNVKPSDKKLDGKKLLEKRKIESKKLSKVQDELSADVQELIEDQTNEKVIQLFEEVEELMANVTDNLSEADTGKETIFKENKIIEKIFEAAKEKSR